MSESTTSLPLCNCRSRVAYRVTAADIPESDAETFEEYDVYESCGMQVSSAKREFRPGHDAKLKSVLIKLYRTGQGFAFLDGGRLIHSDPMNEAKKRGWGHFMTEAPKRKSRAKTKTVEGGVEVETVPAVEEPAGFQPARVKVGRWWKDGVVVERHSHPDAGEADRVTVEYRTSKGAPARITLPANSKKLEIG
jgi:hypothetical protein